MRALSKTGLFAALLVVGVIAIGLVAVAAQASASGNPGGSVGLTGSAAVAPTVSSGLTSTTYTFSTATNPINCGNNSGWWTASTASNSDCNANYLTGRDSSFGFLNGGYAAFDITALTGLTNPCPPSSAYLSVPAAEGSHAFYGSGPTSATLALYDVSTNRITLSAKSNNPNAAISSDLRSGAIYGGPYSLPTTTNGGTFTLSLGSAGLTALGEAKEFGVPYFLIGMGLINPPDHTWLFGFSGSSISLTVAIPKLCKVYP